MKQRGKDDFIKQTWYAYIVRHEASFDARAGDAVNDFEINPENLDEVLDGMQVIWYPPDQDDEIERQYIDIRQQWRSKYQ